MGQLREQHFERKLCQECSKAPPAGPCAACHGMICADCCVMSKDPSGESAICLSCARLVATVKKKSPPRSALSARALTAWLVIALMSGVAVALVRSCVHP